MRTAPLPMANGRLADGSNRPYMSEYPQHTHCGSHGARLRRRGRPCRPAADRRTLQSRDYFKTFATAVQSFGGDTLSPVQLTEHLSTG